MSNLQDEQLQKLSENPNNDGNKLVRDENGRVVAGVLNPTGKPRGTLDFKTKWYKFIDKVAESNKLEPDTVEEQLLAVAFKRAKEWYNSVIYGFRTPNINITRSYETYK